MLPDRHRLRMLREGRLGKRGPDSLHVRKAINRLVHGWKTCSKCKAIRSIHEFGYSDIALDGRFSQCNYCRSLARKKQVYRLPTNEKKARSFERKIALLQRAVNIYRSGRKRCTLCKISRPIKEFHAHKYSVDELSSRCKYCCARHREKITRGEM
jgi:hypothetical protein